MQKIRERLVNWASILDARTREQAERTAAMPFIHPHVALMPDAHLGRGATVGSVIPTLRAIMPAAVGVDIGCGMAAVRTQFDVGELRAQGSLAPLRESIERAIPLGAGHHNRKVVATSVPRVEELTNLAEEAGFDPSRDKKGWEAQLGTLGSGNHFIEVTVDEADRVWLFLHSGSRGVGNKIAQRHTAVAREACAGVDLPDPDLAYLTEDTEEFWAYIRELRWAQHYALLNREEMMDRVVRQTSEFVGTEVVEQERISCHHNYTESEEHFGEQVWVSRKGAIDASAGRAGLIPGSMGTASYVVAGKGEPASLHSSPHGAGRAYSRTAARKTFTHDQLREAMAGIEFRDAEAFLDEIPAAYKDVDVVMADAADLVEVRHTLRQIVNVKGS
ncbi:RtcB family protein [Actinomycetospora chibensis]|uniref:3'-phosphate/5'-hydroxy nucleic acid ligase n=1 Tax=Actinomycetospora chibensis TaxID=663606 RepID=A0ABV9RJX1_9PSEU|nr:RtcB family protein [Actinomycetospora chibensis]MDD7925984.1 RtcB family protein [Actinomycetospora chibensis]